MAIDFEKLKIIETVDFGEYHPAYEGQDIEVWVNPSRRAWQEHPIDEDVEGSHARAFFCTVWQCDGDTYDQFQDAAAFGLWDYVVNETSRLVTEYSDKRKNPEKV